MNYEATLTYSEPLIRQAVFAFWRRSVGVRFLGALLLNALGLAFYLARGEASWIVGVLGTVFTFGVMFIACLSGYRPTALPVVVTLPSEHFLWWTMGGLGRKPDKHGSLWFCISFTIATP